MIERLYSRPDRGVQIERDRVCVVADCGIEGDRNFGQSDEPGRNITFIKAEEIEAFFREQQRRCDLSLTHRNVITRGVRLNDLVGAEFSAGGVRFRGVELCEPCLHLGKALATPAMSAAMVVKRLLHRGGLRAHALSSGEIAAGDRIERLLTQ